jgi:hypothetical protein
MPSPTNQSAAGAESTLPHSTATDALVNAPGEVTLYSIDGRALRVSEADVDAWLRDGYRWTKADPKTSAAELASAFAAAHAAIDVYVEGVINDGAIDSADSAAQATAEAAMRHVEVTWNQLQLDLFALYPVRQGESVLLVDENSREFEVDPNQAADYTDQGYKKVKR